MEVYRRSSWLLLLLFLVKLEILFIGLQGVHAEVEGPSESECQPYIEKALKQFGSGDPSLPIQDDDSTEDIPTIEITTDDSDQPIGYGENEDDNSKRDSNESNEVVRQEESNNESVEAQEVTTDDVSEQEAEVLQEQYYKPEILQESYTTEENEPERSDEKLEENLIIFNEVIEETVLSEQNSNESAEENVANIIDDSNSVEDDTKVVVEVAHILKSETETVSTDISKEVEHLNDVENENIEARTSDSTESEEKQKIAEDELQSKEHSAEVVSKEDDLSLQDVVVKAELETEAIDKENVQKETKQIVGSEEVTKVHQQVVKREASQSQKNDSSNEVESNENEDDAAVEELIEESGEILADLRPTDHLYQLLKLEEDASAGSKLIDRTSEIILRDLKKLYDNAIKPLEIIYKYKDLSNRHFGDSEIFSKPLILFMGPWSGGKSSIINYLLSIEYTEHALHTGAEPSPAYFNILMYGEEPEILDGTQLAADYTFSGLQKFGQGLEERLRGYKLPSKLLEKVNIVEIPGILEVRKQVSRVFPFNDACQWFIDRADIIFLIYDPSKLDVGPETEAILDQLKGREHQTRIVLNKADQVKPEELMRVQGALIWNISPLMSSAQPPIMYTTSLWSKPYETWAPVRLLQAQERAFLRDIRSAVDKRIDNKIASARRFAVRVRNHAKMVDCYLTTYYNHKSVFGNRKQISDEIINHPQDFHIYEGLSTLTNISRYDLPDPDVYRDFFRLNALYDFQQLSATCTYFRGCPINRLDIAIAYDLPELVGKHKKMIETAVNDAIKSPTPKT